MKEPTKRQLEVLGFIAHYIDVHTFPPTIREIATHFSISVKGAYDHIAALKKKGKLKYKDGRSRTLELISVENINGLIRIPVLGVIAAGRPIMAEENWDGFVTIHNSLVKKSGEYFALRVRGDSMDRAGIMDGDMAVVEKTASVDNGEIAVVQLDNKATLKRFFREEKRIRLQPENPDYPPIYIKEDVNVLGRLSAVFRSY
jgi:repressor LexA